MTFLAVFALWVASQVPLLGDPEWATREAAQKRLSHPLAVLFLPPSSENAEIAHRLRRLRAEQAYYCDPEYAERTLYKQDFRSWVVVYLATAKTRIGLEDIYADLDTYPVRRDVMYAVMAPHEGDRWLFNYEWFLAYLHYHWQIAPMPRTKGEP